jgi:hypothetical protein|tara:strand:+ start:2220 stop:2678 length:459 start_codon:yes stop_codon:yes gene_type:complete
MLKTFFLTLFLLLGVATPAIGGWVIVLQDELQEPTLDKLIDWVPEEVPRTVSFYFDTDGDGKFDIKIAYSLIEAFPCRKNCVSKITDNGDHWLLPAPGINYYVIKKWTLYRYAADDDWRGGTKTNKWIFKNPFYDDWLEHEYYPLWPEQRMK